MLAPCLKKTMLIQKWCPTNGTFCFKSVLTISKLGVCKSRVNTLTLYKCLENLVSSHYPKTYNSTPISL